MICRSQTSPGAGRSCSCRVCARCFQLPGGRYHVIGGTVRRCQRVACLAELQRHARHLVLCLLPLLCGPARVACARACEQGRRVPMGGAVCTHPGTCPRTWRSEWRCCCSCAMSFCVCSSFRWDSAAELPAQTESHAVSKRVSSTAQPARANHPCPSPSGC